MKKFLSTTVIIQTQNETKYLDLTLQSLIVQSFHPSNFEVIVLVESDNEEIKRVVSFYKNLLKIDICVGENCKNDYLNKSKSDICLLVKSGIFLHKNCLEEHQKEHLKTSEKIVVVGYIQKAVSQNREVSKNLCNDFREEHYSRYDDRIDLLPAPWVFFSSSNVSISRTELLMKDLHDENYDGDELYEDMDLGFRLCRSKNKMLLNRTASSIDYIPTDLNNSSKCRENQRNRFYFHGKYNTMETKILKEIPSERVMYLNDHIIQFFE